MLISDESECIVAGTERGLFMWTTLDAYAAHDFKIRNWSVYFNWLDLSRLSLDLSRRSLDLSRRSLDLSRRSLDLFRRSLDLFRRSLDLSRLSLDLFRRSLDLSRRSLDLSRRSLDHLLNASSIRLIMTYFISLTFHCEYLNL